MLEGSTIAITRSAADAAEFIDMAESYGATPLALPTIELVARGPAMADDFVDEVRRCTPDYSVFMSSKAVRLLFESASASSRMQDLRDAVSGTIVVAVGPKTRDMLAGFGIRTSHMPDIYSSVGVGEVFTRINASGRRVIIPRSAASTPFLRQLLEKIGLEVHEMMLYDVQASARTGRWGDFERMLHDGCIDCIVFTSASSVRAFFEIMHRRMGEGELAAGLGRTRIVSIGPFTAAELDKRGTKNIISSVHTVRGAFDTVRGVLDSGN